MKNSTCKKCALLFAMVFGICVLHAQVPPGILDLSFGPSPGGWVLTGYPPGAAGEAEDVVVQPDGKVIVGGWTVTPPGATEMYSTVARFDAAGVPDPSFGSAGLVPLDLAPLPSPTVIPEKIVAMAIDPADESIVVVGSVVRLTTQEDIFVCRLNKNGFLVPTFGDNQGCRIIDLNSDSDYPSDVALDTIGRIVISATTIPMGGVRIPALIRLMPNGFNDAGFGIGGYAGFPKCFDCESKGVAVQPDHKIVMAGDGLDTAAVFDIDNRDPFAIRVTTNGTPDPGFANNGLFISDVIFFGEEIIEGMGLYNDGRIMLAGTAIEDPAVPGMLTDEHDLLIVRLRTDGWLDPSCSLAPLGGRILPVGPNPGLIPPLGKDDYGFGMAVDSANCTIVCGFNGPYAILAAIDSKCALASGFGPSGNGTTHLLHNMQQASFKAAAFDYSMFPHRLLAAGSATPEPGGSPMMAAARLGACPVGVFEPAGLDLGLQIYPNPCSGSECYVKLDAPENVRARFELYDLTGRQVAVWGSIEIIAGSQTVRLDLPVDLPAGIYPLNMISSLGRGSILLRKAL